MRTAQRQWSLVSTSEESINSPFYNQLPGIGIANLLWFVAENTGCRIVSRMCWAGMSSAMPIRHDPGQHRGHGHQHGALKWRKCRPRLHDLLAVSRGFWRHCIQP